MKVRGPEGWETTHALREALREVESEKELSYGVGGRKSGVDQFRAFEENGLHIPRFTTSRTEAKGWVREGLVVFGRKQFHTQGHDIIGSGYIKRRQKVWRNVEKLVWIRTRKGAHVQRMRNRRVLVGGGEELEKWNKKWLASEFWVQFVPSTREFRQHIFAGKAIRVGEKIEAGPHPRKQLVRARKNGWNIHYPPTTPVPEGLREVAKKAVESVGYLFGAVDILLGKDGKLYVLEVNSAPSMRDGETLRAYVEAIKKWAKPTRGEVV